MDGAPVCWSDASMILDAMTFDGTPFKIAIPKVEGVGHGATAKILAGRIIDREPYLVAVKVFTNSVENSHQELLDRELQVVRQLSMTHPLILSFIGTAAMGVQKAIVSLYMRNGDLLEYLRSNRKADARKMVTQVAEAVDYLHSVAGLVHGDLKCRNILVSDFGDALLADFGLSTSVDKAKASATTVTLIRGMYTIRFAAPELLIGSGKRSKTCESDVYAFGMLVLEAFTLMPPWFEVENYSVIFQICHGHQPARPQGNALLTDAWWDICQSCWEMEPCRRPSIAGLRRTFPYPPPSRVVYAGTVDHMAYLPNNRVVSCAGNTVHVWDAESGASALGPLHGHRGTVNSVAVSPDGCQIASCGDDGTILRWDAHSGAPYGAPLVGHSCSVSSVCYSRSGEHIASASGDGTVRLWDSQAATCAGERLEETLGALLCVVFSPDDTCISAGSFDGRIHFWNAATRKYVVTSLGGHSDAVSSIAWLPDGRHVLTGSWDATVGVWDLDTRCTVRTLHGHSDRVTTMLVAPCGKYVVAGSRDRTIRRWDVKTGKLIGDPLQGHEDWITAVAFSPDGRNLISASKDGLCRIWQL